MITRLDHVAIAVADWDAALSCYAQLLGQSPYVQPGASGPRAALFALRNTRIVLLEGAAGGEGIAALGLGVGDGAMQLGAADLGRSALEHAAALGAEQAWQLDPARTRGLPLLLTQRAQAELPAADSFTGAQVEALDHVVIRSAAPEQALTLYGETLGIRLALDRELAGTRMLFFRTGGVTLEVIADASAAAADSFYGLAYRVRDLDAVHARLTAAGFALTEPRTGRKPGTYVFSVRSSTCGVPTLFIRDASRD